MAAELYWLATGGGIMISLIIVSIASAVFCHWLAGRRGANRVYWGVMGAFFGPFAIPVLLFRHR